MVGQPPWHCHAQPPGHGSRPPPPPGDGPVPPQSWWSPQPASWWSPWMWVCAPGQSGAHSTQKLVNWKASHLPCREQGQGHCSNIPAERGTQEAPSSPCPIAIQHSARDPVLRVGPVPGSRGALAPPLGGSILFPNQASTKKPSVGLSGLLSLFPARGKLVFKSCHTLFSPGLLVSLAVQFSKTQTCPQLHGHGHDAFPGPC